MQSALKLRQVLRSASIQEHLPLSVRAFRILPDPKRPGQSEPGDTVEKASQFAEIF